MSVVVYLRTDPHHVAVSEVLWLLDARLSIEEIAAIVHIPLEIVRRHVDSCYRKLPTRAFRQPASSGPSAGCTAPWPEVGSQCC